MKKLMILSVLALATISASAQLTVHTPTPPSVKVEIANAKAAYDTLLATPAATDEARLTAYNHLVEVMAKDPNQPVHFLAVKFPQRDDDGNVMPGAKR